MVELVSLPPLELTAASWHFRIAFLFVWAFKPLRGVGRVVVCACIWIPTLPLEKESGKLTPPVESEYDGSEWVQSSSKPLNAWMRSADCRFVLNLVLRSKNFSFQNKTKGSLHTQLIFLDLHEGFCDDN